MRNKGSYPALLLGTLAVVLLIAAGRSPAASETSALTIFTNEAAATRALHPEIWQGYLTQEEAAITAYRARTAHWANEAGPPPLDLKPLHLPLAFLVVQFQQPGHAEAMNALLDAISVSPDHRRIKVLLELRAQWGDTLIGDWGWNRLLTVAADKDWAQKEIEELLPQDPALTPYSLLFSFLDRFAGQLPPAMQTASYNYLRRHWNTGPTNGEGERYWDTLLKIDAERARREILPYYEDKTDIYNPYVVELLSAHAGPSPEVANAVKRWLPSVNAQEDAWTITELRVLLLRSDPHGALPETLAQIARLVTQKKARNKTETSPSDEPDQLIKAVIAINSDQAVAPLAGYAHDPVVDNLTQLEILNWLAKRRYPGMPQAVAQWLADNPGDQQWLRDDAAKEWGDTGRRILQEADQLNKTRH